MLSPELSEYPLTYAEFQTDPTDKAPAVHIISDTVVILPNHMGSSAYNHEGKLGDAARKARGVANRLTGYPVIAFDRFGTGPGAPELKVTPGNAREVALYTGDQLAKIVAQRGYKHVILAGNSAAGTTAVELAVSETLPVSHVCAMDPVAMHEISLTRGFTRWLHFNLAKERAAPKRPRPKDDPIDEATGFSMPAFRQDSAAYRQLWESGVAADAMRQIAGKLGHITGRLYIPENTFTGTPSDNAALVEELNYKRLLLTNSQLDAKPFLGQTGAGVYHSRYEQFDTYATAIAKTIDFDFAGFDE